MKVLVVEPLKECYTKETNGLEEMAGPGRRLYPGCVSL